MAGEARYRRREIVGGALTAAGALAFGPAFWRQALAAEPARPGAGPYGPLRPADANGLMLPEGFRSRIVAQAGRPVGITAYPWHIFPDGQATFATADGGWILVSNSESLAATGAGSSAIRFRSDGSIASAYRILAGTNANCAGGPTPWGTWLSCEEYDGGHVWECDPHRAGTGVIRPALGTFSHEAVAVDPVARRLYMTEDEPDGGFYRFTPSAYPDLGSGLLEVAIVEGGGAVRWAAVPDPAGIPTPTRRQVAAMTPFPGGEGIWYDSETVYFSTKGDNRVRAYHTRSSALEVIYDRAAAPDQPLSGVDNLTVSPSGDVYVCEDGGDMDICLITPQHEVARFLKLTGVAAEGSEMAGVVFDPSGRRMYFSSQRGGYGTAPSDRLGVVYEVTGPFRLPPGRPEPPPAPVPRPRAPRPGEDPADADARGLALRMRRTIARATLARRGMRVRIVVARPGRVTVAVRTSELDRVGGRRGSTDRPRAVTLARATRDLPRSGSHVVTLRPSRRMRARLSRRRSPLRAIVTAERRAAGDVAVATRAVRIGAARAR